ncbi:hypothetical protein D5086_021007 [Populus alba]|uniref:Uncharacterized protein n=1 Tax=Populus alba TaxID=43335 RepID=A0ACC4BLN4_POPAL
MSFTNFGFDLTTSWWEASISFLPWGAICVHFGLVTGEEERRNTGKWANFKEPINSSASTLPQKPTVTFANVVSGRVLPSSFIWHAFFSEILRDVACANDVQVGFSLSVIRGCSTTIVLCSLMQHKQMAPDPGYAYLRLILPRIPLASSQWLVFFCQGF